MSKPRVRFAPSPTGPLHIGGVRTALYNYLFAKKNGGDFILRIEDTDQTRYVPGAEQYIVDSLNWCGIKADEGTEQGGPYGPYKQSERKHLYRQYADYLVENDLAYYAFDTAQELDEMREKLKKAGVASPQYNYITRQSMKNSLTLPADEVQKRIEAGEPYVIRIKIPRNEEIRLHDIIRGWVVVHTKNIDDKVLFKSDGMPTYHLANVVDDYLMKITHVIRGEEWLPSAPLHVLLYKFLGWEYVMPQFAHLPLILRPDGNGKLSKRDGDRLGFPVFPLQWQDPETGEISSGYRESGWFKDAVINMIALLGWHPSNNQEIFSLEELIKHFDLDRVSKAGAKFDLEKAKWFNQQYLRAHSDQELANLTLPLFRKEGINTTLDTAAKVCSLMKERATFLKDIVSESKFIFNKPENFDIAPLNKKIKPETKTYLQNYIALLSATEFNSESLDNITKHFLEENKISFGAFMPVVRILITGISSGPGIFDLMSLIGKSEVIERLNQGLQNHFKQ